MRVLAIVGVALAAIVAVPEPARAKIRFNRGTIVSVSVSELKGQVFGNIKVLLSSLRDSKRDTISARITKKTLVSGSRQLGGGQLTLKDLKPGMTVEITITGQRVGDSSWEARSIRVLEPVAPAIERPKPKSR
jgi:hypothetical protein